MTLFKPRTSIFGRLGKLFDICELFYSRFLIGVSCGKDLFYFGDVFFLFFDVSIVAINSNLLLGVKSLSNYSFYS